MSARTDRAAYERVFAGLHSGVTVVQCTCGRSSFPWKRLDVLHSLGWRWFLRSTPIGTRIAWRCPDHATERAS